MKAKTLMWRMAVGLIVLVLAFTALDMLSFPSESTAAAVQAAVNKQQLEPACLVEVQGAIRSGSFTRAALGLIQISAVVLLCTDVWGLWTSRPRVRTHEPAA